MAHLPRVHEVASEMGVDSKIALRVLKAHGEFVKGPSSSIQPPVARKLKAWLAAGEQGSGAVTAAAVAADAHVSVEVVLRELKALGVFIAGPHVPIPSPFGKQVRDKLALPPQGPHIGLLEVGQYAAVLTRRLPRDLPELAALIRTHIEGEALELAIMRDAIDAGAMFYAPSAAGRLIARAGGATTLLHHEELLAPAGIAVQTHPESNKDVPKWLVGWRIRDGQLEVAQTRFRISSAANGDEPPHLEFEPTTLARCKATDNGYVVAGQEPAQRLAGLAAAIPTAPQPTRGDEPRELRPERANAPTQPEADATVLVYLRRAAGGSVRGEEHRSHEGQTATSARSGQWSVRGFWRNQWYPSEKDHHSIWIDEHVAGNREAPLVSRPRVYIIRPTP